MQHTKKARSRTSTLSRLTKTLVVTSAITSIGMLSLSPMAHGADGLPSNGVVKKGKADLDYSINDQLHVRTKTDFVSINWDDFNIDKNHLTQFHQTSSDAIAVNRVTGADTDPTKILGTLKANGNIMVLDRNGIIFGKDSVVDVGGIIASTGNVSNKDIRDDGKFTFKNFGDGEIKIKGNITVAEAGLAAFVSPHITNSGVIKAKMGRVAMAAGDKVTLDLYGDNLVEIAVDDEIADGLIKNTGTISAAGGEIIVTARVAKSAVENVINMGGVVNATSAKVQGGKIILSGGSKGRVKVKGDIKSNGKKGQNAGSINITGQSIEITDAAEIKARGKDGANAGDIKVIADETLVMNGLISAEGADGTGFVETSAPTTTFGLTASVLANREWLLDPTDILVDAALGGLIEGQLAAGDMTLQTPAAGTDTGNIDIETSIDWASEKTFKVIAHGTVDIKSSGAINATGTGAFEANAGDDVLVNGAITTQGGDVTLIAGTDRVQDDVKVEAAINTNGGKFIATAGDDVQIRDDVTTSGGEIILTALDNTGKSEVSITSVGSLNSGGGNITLNSDDFFISDIAGTRIDAGTGTVNINKVSEGTFGLGSAAGDTTLSAGSLSKIAAATLNIGNVDPATSKTTGISVTDVDLSGIATTNLNALAGAANAVNFSGTNTFAALNAKAQTISVASGETTGTTSIFFDAPTINLNGKLTSAMTSGTASLVNVQSDSADIQDGVDVAATSADVVVSAGTYNESVTISKALNLQGANAGKTGTDATRGAESEIRSTTDHGITITADGVIVNGFKLNGTGATGFNGVSIGAVNGATIQNNIVTEYKDSGTGRNTSNYKTGIGIFVEGASGTIDISNNLADNNTDGIRLFETNAASRGNITIATNNVTNNDDKGIIVKNSDKIKVSQNTMDQNKFGIWLEDSDKTVVNKNTIDNSTENAIRLRTNADNNTLRGNIINGTGKDAIYANVGSDTLKLLNNKIGLTGGADNIKGDAIALDGASNSTVSGNKIANTTNNGIGIDNADTVTITDNEVNNISDDGIDFDTVTNSLIENNRIGTLSGTDNITGDGIDIADGENNRVLRNKIANTKENGIDIEDSDNIRIVKNVLTDSGKNGIFVGGGDKATINKNKITGTGVDGIQVVQTDSVSANKNKIRNTKGDGIYISEFETAKLENNNIKNTGDDGIELDEGQQATVLGNTIKKVGFIDDGANADGRGADAIAIFDVFGDDAAIGFSVDLQDNIIDKTYDDGIEVALSGRTQIIKNTLTNIGGTDKKDYGGGDALGADGIFVFGAIDSKIGNRFDLKINRNTIDQTADDAIQSLLSGDTQVHRNTITNAGTAAGSGFAGGDAIAIFADPTIETRVAVTKNKITSTHDDGIEVLGASDLTLDENTIDQAGDDGINALGFNSFGGVTLLPSYDAIVTNNIVTNSGGDGVQTEGFTTALIETNTIETSGQIGVNVSGFNNGTTTVSENELTDNDTGMQFESGLVDLTQTGNTITGGRIGLRFAPYDLSIPNLSSTAFPTGTGFADLSLVDNDGPGGYDGTIGQQTFDGQAVSYVELDNGAFFAPGTPSVLNALDSTYLNTPFGNITPSIDFPDGLNAEQFAFFEARFRHFRDDDTLGFFDFPIDIEQNRLFDQFDPVTAGAGGLNVTILGLPQLPGSVDPAAALNNLSPAAGGDDDQPLTPEQLNNIDTAAGGDDTTQCWSDAITNAENGITTNVEFGSSAEDLLKSGSCS